MGYSITCRCRSLSLQKKMTAFMEKNYRGWTAVSVGSREAWLIDPRSDSSGFASNVYEKNLAYDSASRAVGFNYNACEPERDYIYAVVRWMALKVGMPKRFKDVGLVPHYVYDGGGDPDSYWPILVRDEWESKVPKDREWCLTTATGFRSYRDKYIQYGKRAARMFANVQKMLRDYIDGGAKVVDKLTSDELLRLNKLWEEQ